MIPRLHIVGLLVAALLVAEPHVVHADDGDGDNIDDSDGVHLPEVLGWSAILMTIPGWYYWHTQDAQEVDFTDPSWKDKLFTLHSWRFDTNAFHVNALRHPFVGVGDYQIARSNGFGALGSAIFAYATGVFWELCVEYREDPSINDAIMNGAGGVGIGEPFYQIGQLWRGGELSAGDRLRTAAFSPWNAVQDLYRPHRGWHRPRAWADFALAGGVASHRLAPDTYRSEIAVSADIDAVRHVPFVTPGVHEGPINAGAWSRVMLGARLADLGDGYEPVMTTLRTRTSLVGKYYQDAEGNGALLALGAGYTYRRDKLDHDEDHFATAHLLGPQVQLSRRTGASELRLDLAAYVDFAMVDAHVFGPKSPLPAPPPFLSTLQSEGYYDAGAGSLEARFRADHGMFHADVELTAHKMWSLDFADRVQQGPDLSRVVPSAVAAPGSGIPAAPHGVSDFRGYGHASVGVRHGDYGLALNVDGVLRNGRWRDLSRTDGEWTVGLGATANL